MKSILSVLGILLAVFVLYSPSSAMMIGLSTEELTANSQAVIKGIVEDKQSYWSSDGKMIMTKAYVRADEVIKQKSGENIQPGSRIPVEYLGGEADGVVMIVSVVSPLAIGEEVVLFLAPSDSKRAALYAGEKKPYNIFGFAQGKYSLDENGIAKKDTAPIISKKAAVENNLPVEELINKIKGVK